MGVLRMDDRRDGRCGAKLFGWIIIIVYLRDIDRTAIENVFISRLIAYTAAVSAFVTFPFDRFTAFGCTESMADIIKLAHKVLLQLFYKCIGLRCLLGLCRYPHYHPLHCDLGLYHSFIRFCYNYDLGIYR